MKHHVGKWIRWVAGLEPLVLVALLLVTLGVWGFVEVAGEVVEGDTEAFDRWLLRSLRKPDNPAEPLGPEWMHEFGRDVTGLGGAFIVGLLIAATAGFLWLDRRRRMAAFLVAATVSGLVVSLGLKELFARPRPDVVPHLAKVQTSSFPSAHSMLSAVVYLTLGVLVAAAVPARSLRVYAIGVAVLITGLVGVSRVYLGVHYPTDVLAGWTAGLVWALGCWLVARWLQRRGDVEPADTEHAGSTN